MPLSSKRQFLYLNADGDASADIDAEMPMPRFPNERFRHICKNIKDKSLS